MSSTNVITNFFWRFLERCGAQGVTFIVSIVLARLLDPTVYGTVALVTIFTTIMQVFVDSGMGNALIQKKDADDLDFSSVFYFNMAMCSVLYLIMFFAAPFIASFYRMPELTAIVRVLSFVVVISGVKNVQQAYVSRHLMFKRFFFSTLGGTIGAAVIGIAMAYLGFGVWALVAQMLFNAAVDTTILWITVKWRPKKMFSFQRLKSLFSYGWKLLASSLIDTVYNDLRQLIIGKKYSSGDLAYYNQGKKFPQLIVTNINTSIDSVLLPTMSKAQDDMAAVRSMTRRAIKTSTFLMMPAMIGLAVCAEPLVQLILTEKWLPCVLFLRIFCITYAFYPIHTANLNAIKAMGRSDLFLKLEIIKKTVGIIAILITMWISVQAMAYSFLVTTILNQIINSWPNKKLLNYSYLEQVKDMMPQILLSLGMGAAIYAVSFLHLSASLTLLIQIPLGVLVYWSGSKIFHVESYTYIIEMVKNFKKRKKKA
ncbi:MAG: lipopolysaccharide biosynthesis protein [Ruminococcus sp.]|jgi:O-antigen/teichoic acid export membrane protein|uniref:lipopolysaccharide biosynthesis protein n=1 Tax=Ruminococcus callidus TaxID=40519 RepID=UPI001D030C29|nr:lipopolysaccharide biosynthesis protein [Ruminococcus callidus]MCB5774848.1 lipopolysaccharide biosynthesis protein [Ruminococcus callidus]MCC2759019.1 lipopolysaccharide biosynthesis protein [Ruminococcus callidus]